MNDLRREKLIQILVADPKKSMESAMIEAGYSPSYAGSVGQIKKTDAFIEKLDEAIKDDGIVSTMKAILNRRTRIISEYPMDTPDEEILDNIEKTGGEFPKIKEIVVTKRIKEGSGKKSKWVDVEIPMKQASYYLPDEGAVQTMLDKLFKLKGKYAPEKGLVVHTQLSEYLDMIQSGEHQEILPSIQNAEPITKENL